MVIPEIAHVYNVLNDWVHLHPLAQSLISGLSLSSLITLGLAWVKSRADRIERTFKLHGEFSSFEFIKARNQAYRLLARNRTLTFREIVLEDRLEEQLVYLTRLLTFYEHLSISIRSGYIDKKMGCRYFGMVFIWWYCVYFNTERGLKSVKWEVAKDIHALYDYFKTHAPRKDFEAWLKNAADGATFEQDLEAEERAAKEQAEKVRKSTLEIPLAD